MYHLFCDGSAIYNPRRGGWGFILQNAGHEVWCNGFVERKGINPMELLAVVEGLDRIPDPSQVDIYTDSIYVIVGCKKSARGELWERFFAHKERHQLKLIKVKSHPDHTRAHHLAREAVFNSVSVYGESRPSLPLLQKAI
jgi:ribonuclease HI